MKRAMKYLRMASPFLHLAAEEIADIDDNDTGADDKAAAGINYAADIIAAISKGDDIPYPPAVLLGETAGRK
ncbi:MAG TPA: hypothetical protein VF762_21555 [Blastocatellia bacterium]|jgi:hypothetical protein